MNALFLKLYLTEIPMKRTLFLHCNHLIFLPGEHIHVATFYTNINYAHLK